MTKIQMLLASPLFLVLAACPSPRPGLDPSPNQATLVVVNGASSVGYDVLLDGQQVTSVPAGTTREVTVAPGSRRLELRFSGSPLPALVDTVALTQGQRRMIECRRDCNTERIAGLRFSNASRETTYEVTFGSKSLGSLSPGTESEVILVTAGFDRLQAKVAGTNEVACTSTISANACQVGAWSCNRDLCQMRQTGKVRLTNGFARTAVLEISGARIVLAPAQTSEPIIQPAGQVEVRLRDAATNAILCGGPVAVVQCETRTYVCRP